MKRRDWILVAAAMVVAVVALFWLVVFHWILTFSGANDEAGPWYGWNSGAGANLAYFGSAFAIIGGFYHHHNCAHRPCPRLSSKRSTGHGHALCKKHLKVDVAELDLPEVHESHL